MHSYSEANIYVSIVNYKVFQDYFNKVPKFLRKKTTVLLLLQFKVTYLDLK